MIFINKNLGNMKIGIDAHNLEQQRTGTGRYLINLLKHWSKETSIEFVLYFKEYVPKDIPDTKNFYSKILNSTSNALFMHHHLSTVARKDNIDILFCPNYIAPLGYKRDIALVLHDIIYEARPRTYNWPSAFDRVLLKQVSKKSAKKAKMIFTCSEFSKKEILKYYKVDPKKVFVIPLAADDKFTPHYPDLKTRKNFIFYVGTIVKRRFVPQIITAFEKIKEKVPEFKFLIIGKNFLDQKIKGENIIYREYVDDYDLSLLYNTASLFVWLSEYEGFGLPPLEAMACGTPVLSTKKTSLAEVLGDYPIWIENPESVKEISEKMYKILTDKDLQKKLSQKGIERAQKFSWEKTARETLRVLGGE